MTRDPRAEALPTISREEVASRLGDPALVVVNALPRAAWAAGRIPGSVSLPVAHVAARAAAVLPDRNAEIAVYCAGPT